MKKISKIFVSITVAFAMALLIIPTINVQAADTYTITYRAGNVGTFNTSGLANVTVTGSTLDVTENYVKVTLAKDTSKTELENLENILMNNVTTDEGYFVLDSGDWGCDSNSDTTVTKNKDYVVDYGVLVDPVSYTIQYVDSASGEQIAPSAIVYGNANETITRSPLAISGYSTTDGDTSLTLTKGGSNVITFTYTSTATTGTVTNTVINLIPTTTTTTTIANAATAATATPNATTNANGNADDTTTIDDQNTAAADNAGTDDGTTDSTTIDDEDSAAAANATEGNSYLVPILIGILAALVIIGVVLFIVLKRKKATITTDTTKKTDKQ